MSDSGICCTRCLLQLPLPPIRHSSCFQRHTSHPIFMVLEGWLLAENRCSALHLPVHVFMTLMTHHIFHVCQLQFSGHLCYQNTLIFRNPFHRSNIHTIGFTLLLFVLHKIILNIITQTWSHLVCLYVTTLMNRSSLHHSTRSVLSTSCVSSNSNSSTSCHCHIYATCHRPPYIVHSIYLLLGVLFTIYSIYTIYHFYRILSNVFSNSI